MARAPVNFVRLKRALAEKLGLKYEKRYYVSASLKRITVKTKLYTRDTVAKLRFGVSREKQRLIDKVKTLPFKTEPRAQWFDDLKNVQSKTLKEMIKAGDNMPGSWRAAMDAWQEKHPDQELNPFHYK